MKVLMINGSPNEFGCTYTALCEVARGLNENGVDTEILHIGTQPVSGCLGCGGCTDKRCVIDDVVNVALEKAEQADGLVFGSPVHFAGISGSMAAFMDRFFYTDAVKRKPAAAVVSCRRGGSSAALDILNKYITYAQMPLVSSGYWNMVHGTRPEEVRQDKEGMWVMHTLGCNMAWLIKCIEAGRSSGVPLPVLEPRSKTNFIR
ncbi:MAG: flavodoxin family protein [Oscillospiraceae bacterium]|nr:flavodoxin family protein [Oscillospiraceae bacterium]